MSDEQNNIADGWKVKKLGKLCDISIGKTPSRGNPVYWDKDKKTDNVWLSIRDLNNTKRNIISDSLEYLSDEGAKLFKEVKKDTLLVSFKLTLGRLAFAGRNLRTNEAIASLSILDKTEINSKYLFYYLNFFDWNKAAEGDIKIKGKTLNKKKLGNIGVFYPSFSEQQRIVSILDETFSAIEKVKSNAEKNLQNSKKLFESSLHDIFEKEPSNWVQKTLEEISLEFGRGKSKHRPRNAKILFGGEYPFIQTGDIRNCNHYINDFTQTYNEVGLAQSKLWQKGTICITIAANIAETGILNFDACFPDSVIGITVNPKLAENNFVEYLLQFFKTEIQREGKGSAQANINLATFKNYKFPFPDISTQKQIVIKLNELSEKTEKLKTIYQQKLNDLEKLKKSILQKAFSGEL